MKAKQVGIIGKKLGMTQMYVDGKMAAITVLEFSDMKLIGQRTEEKDGYVAAILGFDFNKKQKPRYVKEIRVDKPEIYESDEYMSTLEQVGKVDVFGTMKGRGFTGAMKRHGFGGGPASHGAKHWHRRVGSIGGASYPAKVWKGQKMPGHYGNTRISTLNEKLVKVDKDQRLLFIKGSVPGSNGSYVMVRDSLKGSGKK